MGVYSTTAANAYADKIKAVYEYLDEIRKVADRLTPVEDLTVFQAQIEAVYANLDLLVETSGLMADMSPTGAAILTGTVASIKALLEIGVIPDDVVLRGELDAALAALEIGTGGQIGTISDQLEVLSLSFDDWTQFVQVQQTQINGLQTTSNDLLTGQATNQTNLETVISRLTIQEENAVVVDSRLDTIDQSITSVSQGVQATNDVVSGHTASISSLGTTTSLHTSSIDQLNSDLIDANTGIAANASALSDMETTILGIGEDIIAQSEQTTALKSAIGGSGNLLPNADFGADANGWEIVVAEDDWATTVLTIDTFNMPAEVHCLEVLGTPAPDGEIVVRSPPMLIDAAQHYIVSGYPCVDNGLVTLSYKVFDTGGGVLDQGSCPNTFNTTTISTFANYTRTWVKFLAPVGAVTMRLYLTVTGDGDFITQGALFRPMVERAWAEQAAPGAWTPNITGVPEALATAMQTLTTEVATVSGEMSAISSAQTDLVARIATAESALINEMITSANKNAATAATLNILTTQMTDVEAAVDASSSIVNSMDSRVTSVEGTITSHTSTLTSLQAQVDAIDEGTGGAGAAISALDTRVDATEASIVSQGNAITSLQNSVTSANKIFVQDAPPATAGRTEGDLWFDSNDGNKPYTLTGGSWVARQDLNKNKIFCQDTQPTATAVGDLWIETDNGNKPWRWNGTTWIDAGDGRITANASAISTLQTRATTIEGNVTASANAITALQSTVNNGSTGVVASANAISTLQTRASTIEGVNQAQATSISTLNTVVDGHTSTITTHATSINGLSAKWNVTLDVNNYITGLESINNGTRTEFNIRADKFRLTPSGGGARTEFSDGNWRVYDAAGVLRVRMGVW